MANFELLQISKFALMKKIRRKIFFWKEPLRNMIFGTFMSFLVAVDKGLSCCHAVELNQKTKNVILNDFYLIFLCSKNLNGNLKFKF